MKYPYRIPDGRVKSVSVVIPTYNRAELLIKAIRSCQEQSGVPVEVIVVDDGSTDGTYDRISQLKDQRVKVVRNERNRERSASRNRGIGLAHGDAILFLDDDDVLLEGALKRLVGALNDGPVGAVAAVGGVEIQSDVGIYRGPVARSKTILEEPWLLAVAGWYGLQGSSLFRKDILKHVGGFAEGLEPSEDQDLWMRVGRRGSVIMIPERVAGIRFHAGQGGRGASDVTKLQQRIREEFLETLPQEDVEQGRRAADFWWEWRRAHEAFSDANGLVFLRRLARAARVDISILMASPFRVGLGRKMAKSLIPRPLWLLLRRVRTSIGWGVVEESRANSEALLEG